MPGLVLEKRKHPRVNLAASGLLVFKKGSYPVRLENISLAGVLVTLQEEGHLLERGERCTFELYRRGCSEALRISLRVVHAGFDMACLRIDKLDLHTRLLLRSIIAHQMPEQCPAPARSSACRG